MRRCIFCGGQVNSREHVWPEWVLALGNNTDPIGGYRGDQAIFINPPKASLKIRHLCARRCNGGWMSTLEGRAKPVMLPLIADKRSTLTVDQQELIATWAVKTAMVVEFLNEAKDKPFYTTEERRLFMESSTLPSTTIVWLGRYYGRLSPVTAGIRIGNIDKQDHVARGVHFTIIVGALAIQVLTIRRDQHRTIRLRAQPGLDWSTALFQVWPTSTAVRWPPPLAFTDIRFPNLRTLVYRFWLNPPPNPLLDSLR